MVGEIEKSLNAIHQFSFKTGDVSKARDLIADLILSNSKFKTYILNSFLSYAA